MEQNQIDDAGYDAIQSEDEELALGHAIEGMSAPFKNVETPSVNCVVDIVQTRIFPPGLVDVVHVIDLNITIDNQPHFIVAMIIDYGGMRHTLSRTPRPVGTPVLDVIQEMYDCFLMITKSYMGGLDGPWEPITVDLETVWGYGNGPETRLTELDRWIREKANPLYHEAVGKAPFVRTTYPDSDPRIAVLNSIYVKVSRHPALRAYFPYLQVCIVDDPTNAGWRCFAVVFSTVRYVALTSVMGMDHIPRYGSTLEALRALDCELLCQDWVVAQEWRGGWDGAVGRRSAPLPDTDDS
ncbi:uncharacterized protein K452DRAFT_302555 [Aplosporella prunicola CBS 121167]|uniref:Uncharacterized protein n=1 Tax=Aplosporella prunicola CBS 121167 TaxID=1176127 RepID=A0A6A6AXK6_9PEZI|nr:uncharacterized protein K452DRAFT_302555 [Aplosporella prunicola CBS 121167]KAF2136692.1 hypothetical protein K452DRAFT_302555 [Aplosporella prunicola CBS 121167]